MRVLSVEISSGSAPTSRAVGSRERLVERDPRGVLVEVALHAERRPGVEFGLDGRSRRPRLGAQRLAGEVDPGRSVRPDREVESVALRREGIGGVQLEGVRLVGADRSVGSGHASGTEARPRNAIAVADEHPFAGGLGQLGQGFDRRTRDRLAEREWVIRPERDPILAHDARDEAQRVGIMGQRVDVDPSDGLAWFGLGRGGRKVGSGMESRLDPSKQARERPAAMGEQQAKVRMTVQDATQHHRRDRQRQLRRHPDEPRQPVAGHPFRREHVPGVDEDGRTQRRRGGQDRLDGRVVQVAVTHVGPDLDPVQPEFGHASFQLGDREVRVLQRDGPEPREPIRLPGHDLGDVVVEQAGHDDRIGGRLVVGEHDRHRREHLQPHAVRSQSSSRRAGSQQSSSTSRKTRSSMTIRARRGPSGLELRPAAVPESRPEIRPGRRQDVGVDVDPVERHERLRGSPASVAA